MVPDAGKTVEFGKQSELLEIEDGKLKVLVDKTSDARDTLYGMAVTATGLFACPSLYNLPISRFVVHVMSSNT